jgi:gamma-glutamylputrescine oxidase
VARYEQYAQQAQSLGIPVEFWDQARTKDEIGTEVYFGSLFDPNAGEVHPMKLVCALKLAAESAGAHIYEDSPVFEIQDGEDITLIVGEPNHRVTAKAVVLATNGYTSKLGYFKNSVFPIHTPMATTPILPESTFEEIGWLNKAGFSDTYTLLYHLSRTADNRILIGSGYVNYFFNNGIIDKDDPEMLKALLQKELGRIYPKLAGMAFEHFWTGVLGFSLDFMQSVGVMGAHRNIYYGLAYAGHGINLATLFGKVIADIYAGEANQWQGLPFLSHHYFPLPPEPLKWVGVQAIIRYYQAEDARK